MADPIGAVQIDIVGDQTKLNAVINSAVGTAQAGGEKISNAFNAAAIKQATLQLSIDQLRQKYEGLAQAGVRTESQQRQMEATSTRLAIAQDRLALAVAQTPDKFEKVAVAADHAAAAADHMAVSGQQATSALIRVGEGSGGLRAVENFLAKTLGLGPAMQAIFPLVGAIAFIEILGRMVGKLSELATAGKDAKEKNAAAWNELNRSYEKSNDELDVTNAKLDEQISKLSGHPVNGLAAMLAEDKVAADELNESLAKTLKEMAELLDKQKSGVFESIMSSGIGQLGSLVTGQNNLAESALKNVLAGQSGVAGMYAKFQKLSDEESATLEAIKQGTASKTSRYTAAGAVPNTPEQQSAGVRQYYGQRQIQSLQDTKGGIQKILSSPDQLSQLSAREIEQFEYAARALQTKIDNIRKSITSQGKKDTVSKLTVGKENTDLAKKDAEEWLKQEEKKLQLQKSQGNLSVQQEIENYDALIAVAQSRGSAYTDIVVDLQIKANNLNLQYIKERGDASVKAVENQGKEFAAKLKAVMEEASISGEMPKTAGLQLAQSKVAAGPSPDIGGYTEALRQIAELTKGAEAESEAFWKNWIKNSGEGIRSAEEMVQHEDALVNVLQQLGGFEDEISAALKRRDEAQKKVEASQEKIDSIRGKQAEASAEAVLDQQKIAIQDQYALKIVKSYQDQIAYADALAAKESEILQLRVDAATAALILATADGNDEKIEEAKLAAIKAQAALRNQTQTAAGAHEKLVQGQGLGAQIGGGLGGDIDSAAQRMASAFGQAVASGKGIGQAFSAKPLEGAAISTVMGAVMKQAIESSGIKTVVATLTTTIVSHAGVMLTHAGVMLAHLGALLAHMGVMIAHMGVLLANTLATLANTLAVIWNSIVLAVKAIFGFAGGGRPPVGTPSMVGERGPELFIPDVPGTIIPNHKLDEMAGGSYQSATNINSGSIGQQHFHIYGMNNPREVMRQIAQYSKSGMPKFSPLNG